MTTKTRGILYFSFVAAVILTLAYFVGRHIRGVEKFAYIVTSSAGAPAQNEPLAGSRTVTTFPKNKVVEFDSIVGNWGVINVNYRPTFVALSTVKPFVPATIERPGPGQHCSPAKEEDLNYFWSTNRIIERLPDFGLLRGKVGNPDMWFWGAGFLLLIVLAVTIWAGEDFEGGTWEFAVTYVLLLLASVCEGVYLLSSEEPLSFFSPDNVGWWSAIWRFGALFVILMWQLSIVVCVLYEYQETFEHGYLASWISYIIWGGALCVTGIFVCAVFEQTPDWWYWIVCAVVIGFPLLAMAVSSGRCTRLGPLLVAAPFYFVCGTVLMVLLSVLLIVIVTIFITYLLIRTALMFLGDGTMKQKIDGTYVFMFPDGSTSLHNRFSW